MVICKHNGCDNIAIFGSNVSTHSLKYRDRNTRCEMIKINNTYTNLGDRPMVQTSDGTKRCSCFEIQALQGDTRDLMCYVGIKEKFVTNNVQKDDPYNNDQ